MFLIVFCKLMTSSPGNKSLALFLQRKDWEAFSVFLAMISLSAMHRASWEDAVLLAKILCGAVTQRDRTKSMQSNASKLPFYVLGWRTFLKLSLVRKQTPSKYHLGSCIYCFSRTSTSDYFYGRIKIYLLCWLVKAGPWKSSSLLFYACNKQLRAFS